MAKLIHTGKISSVASGDQSGITRHHELDSHETLQDALDATMLTKSLRKFWPH